MFDRKKKDHGDDSKKKPVTISAASKKGLGHALENLELALVFRQYLHQWYSHENLAFWTAAEDYKTLPEADRKRRAQEIHAKYFSPTSDYELNVNSEMKKQLEQHLLLHDPGPHVFDNIQKSIWALMETDCYPRFLESDLYKDYQKRREDSNSKRGGKKKKEKEKKSKKSNNNNNNSNNNSNNHHVQHQQQQQHQRPQPGLFQREERSESLMLLEKYICSSSSSSDQQHSC